MKNIILTLIIALCTFCISFAQTTKTTRQKLQGEWQSAVCKKCYFIFKGNILTNNDGNFVDIQNYQIGDTNPNIDEEEPNDNGRYLVIGDDCLYIEKLTATSLQLITIKGEKLNYKKVK
jgi:hypothetical protein